MDTLVFAEKLEIQRRMDKRVRFMIGSNDHEGLLVTIDGKPVASLKFAPQTMVVRNMKTRPFHPAASVVQRFLSPHKTGFAEREKAHKLERQRSALSCALL